MTAMTLIEASNTSAWIQAGAAIVGAVLSLVTLMVLIRYAADTKKIAEASVSQIENSQIPFLTVAWRDVSDKASEGWEIQNQGAGPALSIRFTQYDLEEWRSVADIAKADRRVEFHNNIKQHIQNIPQERFKNRPFKIEYSSLSGVRYRTTVERLPNKELQTKFERISE